MKVIVKMHINNKKQWISAGSTVKTVEFLWTFHECYKDVFELQGTSKQQDRQLAACFVLLPLSFCIFSIFSRLLVHISPLFTCGIKSTKKMKTTIHGVLALLANS